MDKRRTDNKKTQSKLGGVWNGENKENLLLHKEVIDNNYKITYNK